MMVRRTSCEASKRKARASAKPTPPAFHLRIPVLVIGAIIASVPFYGFFVHATRNSQETGLLIFYCWCLGWVFTISSVILTTVSPPRSESARLTALLLTIYLFTAGVIGIWGAYYAVGELLAG